MVGSADASNPTLVGIAAYLAVTVVDSDRAVTQCLTEWDEVRVEVDEDGSIIGYNKFIGMDKRDRTMEGKWKKTSCTSSCTGNVVIDDNGYFDASQMCPVHIQQYLKVLWAKVLDVSVDDIKGQIWADLCLLKAVPKKYTLVAWDEFSPGFALKSVLESKGVTVITRAEEKTSGKKSGLYFEVKDQPYASHPWGESSAVTQRLRLLALAAQRQACRAGTEAPFGDAYRMKDFYGLLSSKTPRRTYVTLGMAGGLAPERLIARGPWREPRTMIGYNDADAEGFIKDGENIPDVIVGGVVCGSVTKEGLSAALLRMSRELVLAEAENLRMRKLLEVNSIPFRMEDLAVVQPMIQSNGAASFTLRSQGQEVVCQDTHIVSSTGTSTGTGNSSTPTSQGQEVVCQDTHIVSSTGTSTGTGNSSTPTSKRLRLDPYADKYQHKMCTPACEERINEAPDVASLATMLKSTGVTGVADVHQALHDCDVHVRCAVAQSVSKRLKRMAKTSDQSKELAAETGAVDDMHASVVSLLHSGDILEDIESFGGALANELSDWLGRDVDSVQLFLTTLDAHVVALNDIMLSADVAMLVDAVCVKTRVAAELYWLKFEGHRLEEGRSLLMYGIKAGSRIEMCVRGRGGMERAGSGEASGSGLSKTQVIDLCSSSEESGSDNEAERCMSIAQQQQQLYRCLAVAGSSGMARRSARVDMLNVERR